MKRNILIIYLLLSSYLFCQDIQFKHITIDDGLSQSTINCIFQDSKGFIWVGTENGLNRYDGYNFSIFKHEPSDSGSLSNSWIWDIFEDKQNNLWIATWEGLNKYDPYQNKIIRYLTDPNNPHAISGDRPTSICEDENGLLWIGTWGGGINIYDPEKNQFKSLRHNPDDKSSIPSDQIRDIYYSSDKKIVAATWNGLSFIEQQTAGEYKIISYQRESGKPGSLNSSLISSVVEDKFGDLWIGTFGGGLHKFQEETNTFKNYKYKKSDRYSLSSNGVMTLFIDSQDNLWIGTVADGLNRYWRQEDHFTRYRYNPDDKNSLNGDNIFSIFEDSSGLLWIGANGLNIYNPKGKRFRHFSSDSKKIASVNHNQVTSFFEDRYGLLWIGTDGGGLNRYNPDSEEFSHFVHNPQDQMSLSNNNITSIVGRNNDIIWISTMGGGLNKFNIRTGRIDHLGYNNSIPETEGMNFIKDVGMDHQSSLWIATYDRGLIQYDVINDKYYHFRGNPEDESILSSNYLLAVYVDSENDVWIGSWGSGICCYKQDEKRFIRYIHEADQPGTICGNIINTIYETKRDSTRTIWVGTNTGLSYMNLDKPGPDNFEHIFRKDGLPGNVICGILEDGSGNLWISTNAGICKFNPDTRSFQNYDKNDGLQSNEFIAGSNYKGKKEQFYFGGINGFNTFYPDSIRQSNLIPPVVFTSFRIFDQPASFSHGLNSIDTVTIQYWQNFFSFEFAAMDFTMPVKNQYAYMLEGFNKEWIYSGSRRYASYTNLDPGNYVLRIKGTNSDGVWNETGTSLKVIIIPPIWQTWWAYGIYSILIIGSILGVIKMRSWKLEKEKNQLEIIVNERTNEIQVKNIQLAEQTDKLKEMDQIKSRFFANISHEFRTPLTLIKGPAEEMLKNSFQGKPEKAYSMILRNANRLLSLINQLLDLSKLESGNMRLKAALQSLSTFINVVVSSFSSLAVSRNILLQYIKPQDEIEIYYDHDKLEKVLNNLLSNAFKFTPENGFITITLDTIHSRNDSYPDGAIKISVHDSGVGVSEDDIDNIFERFTQGHKSPQHISEGSGIGLALTKELVELHHGHIGISSIPDEGTMFDVILPMGKTHLKLGEITEFEVSEKISGDEISVQIPDLNVEISDQIYQEKNENIGEKHLILIVEDHTEVRSYIKEHLDNDYQVLEADNGAIGIAIAKEHLPDLIISDVMMPEMDGYELTDMLKKDSLTSHIPIILLTAKVSDEDRIEGLETGADAYMAKPFNARELKIRTEKLIESRIKLREIFRKEFLLEPTEIKAVSLDEKFIKQVHDIIDEKMSDSEFNVEVLLKDFAFGQKQFTRKVLALTGQTPVQFIRVMRLKRARRLIERKAGSVSEIAFKVGFNNLSYFSKCFRQQFGMLPSEING